MKIKKLLDLDLKLFDGAGGDGGSASGEGNGTAAPTQAAKQGEQVVYGKQSNDVVDTQPQTEEPQTQVSSDTLDDKRRAFNDLISGEYKDQYTEATQNIINRRFKETKNLEAQVNAYQPIMDMLSQRYGVENGDPERLLQAIEDDDGYWEQQAEDAGMTVGQFKEFNRMQRENEALRRYQQAQEQQVRANQTMQEWYRQAEETAQIYPGFSLEAESQNPQFIQMLQSGVPVQHAYEVLHLDDIRNATAQVASQRARQAVTENIKAKGSRPSENGAKASSAFTVKDDVSKLSRKDRAEIARRVERGETISF